MDREKALFLFVKLQAEQNPFKMDKRKNHDSFVKTAFGNPKLMAQLLRLSSRHNKSLKELLAAINLETLTPMPGEATREGLQGSADLAFRVNLADGHAANLHVGIILEHKSYKDNNVLRQLMHYYFEVVVQKAGNIPTVAIILYNGCEKWNPLAPENFCRPYPQYPDYFNRVGYPFVCEFIDVGNEIKAAEFMTAEPQLVLALLAMRYIFDSSERDRFNEALKNFNTLGQERAIAFVNEVFVYLTGILPDEDRKNFMDTEEIYRNKGYISIAEADEQRGYERGCEEARKESAATIAAQAAEIAALKAALAAKA